MSLSLFFSVSDSYTPARAIPSRMAEFAFLWDSRQLNPLLDDSIHRALTRTLRMAGSGAARGMKSKTVELVRATRNLKVKEINRATPLQSPVTVTDLNDLVWHMPVSGRATRLIAFPHSGFKGKGIQRGGMRVKLKTGAARIEIQAAFVARMPTGHVGIFRRKGKAKLPIQELFGPRISDIVGKNAGMKQAIMMHAQTIFGREFERLWPMNLKKALHTGAEI